METIRRFLFRRSTLVLVVLAFALETAPVRADVPAPVETVTGECVFQGATIEGVAVSTPPTAVQTGIVCNVYENGVHRGACGLILEAPAAACAFMTGPVIGPPRVCTYAFATFRSGRTAYDEHCWPG